jgi:hypothetical protein
MVWTVGTGATEHYSGFCLILNILIKCCLLQAVPLKIGIDSFKISITSDLNLAVKQSVETVSNRLLLLLLLLLLTASVV